jgi:hypothetical protein
LVIWFLEEVITIGSGSTAVAERIPIQGVAFINQEVDLFSCTMREQTSMAGMLRLRIFGTKMKSGPPFKTGLGIVCMKKHYLFIVGFFRQKKRVSIPAYIEQQIARFFAFRLRQKKTFAGWIRQIGQDAGRTLRIVDSFALIIRLITSFSENRFKDDEQPDRPLSAPFQNFRKLICHP